MFKFSKLLAYDNQIQLVGVLRNFVRGRPPEAQRDPDKQVFEF